MDRLGDRQEIGQSVIGTIIPATPSVTTQTRHCAALFTTTTGRLALRKDFAMGIEEMGAALIGGLIIGATTGYALTMWRIVEPLREERDNWRGLYEDAWDYAAGTFDDDDWDIDDEFEWKLTDAGRKMAEGDI